MSSISESTKKIVEEVLSKNGKGKTRNSRLLHPFQEIKDLMNLMEIEKKAYLELKEKYDWLMEETIRRFLSSEKEVKIQELCTWEDEMELKYNGGIKEEQWIEMPISNSPTNKEFMMKLYEIPMICSVRWKQRVLEVVWN